jgi:hypothetical protein
MLAHPIEHLKHEFGKSLESQLAEARAQLGALEQWVGAAAREGVPAHEVERHLFDGVLRLGATLFDAFLKLVGPGEVGTTATLDDGRVVPRLEEPRARRLLTVFGQFVIKRWVYAQRDGQKIELAPTDQRLQLPESDLSYLLQEWDQMLGIEHAFGKVRDTLESVLRLKQPVDTLERNNRQMAEPMLEFHESQPPAQRSDDAELLVATEDNKGIPMVRPAAEKPVGAHRAKGEKANKKQMACLGCVYSVDRHVRTAQELVAILFRDPDRPQTKLPEAQQKRYWAELTQTHEGVEVRGQELVFAHLSEEIERRRRPRQMLIHLCDGQKSLETDRASYLPIDAWTVDILDLMHAIPRLWEAAHVFHAEGSPQASAFVRERLLEVLNGRVASVVRGLRYLGTARHIAGADRKRLRRACAYLKANQHRMRYDEYLRKGYPIATGVIEGACRHVIKDRMERAGMRWQVPGAQAMLHLRAVSASGDWEKYQQFRIESENQRLYPNKRSLNNIDWPFPLAI